MTLKLFLDDERFPPDDGCEWAVVRSVDAARRYMEEHGCPAFISFDHDLGAADAETGADLVNWMIERDLDMEGRFIPADFDFYAHSQNSVGSVNITLKLRPYLNQRFG